MTSPTPRLLSRRNLLATSAIAGTGALLAGCGSGTPGQSASEAQNPQSPGSTTTVQFWQSKLTNAEDAWYKKMVEQFNTAQSEVKVVLTQVPGDAWEQKIKAAQAAGKAPDMYIGVGNNVWVQVENGELADLTDVLPKESWDDLTDTARELVTVNGKHYAYPMLFEPQTVLYYRKDFFEAAGLDPEVAPKSWAELVDFGAKTKADGRFGLVMGVTGGDFGWQSWPWQRNVAGHLPISDDWSTAQANDPAYAKLAQLYRDLFDAQAIPKQSLGPANDSTPFGQNKAAMMINGSWAISQILDEFEGLRDKVGVAPIPTHDGTGAAPATNGNMKWMIDAKSKHIEAVGKFFLWALAGPDPAVMLDYFKVTGFSKFPTRTSLVDAVAKAPDADTLNPWRKVIQDQVLPSAALEPQYDWTVAEAFGQAMEKSMRGADIPKSLEAANSQIQDIITKLKLTGKAPKN
ncbi:ABC transporter substrate-binding protein [Microlunatus sp. GCM10028923]|uniref:ABC transporter substrate-binding protein n=1 Tax=Microlunatus sp. GCM10028923 TaxID=3273400 RepID=UPI003614536A